MKVSKWLDNENSDSYTAKLRLKRFELFKYLLKSVPEPVKILDVGGTVRFWEVMGFGSDPVFNVTLLNLELQDVSNTNFTSVVGNAVDMACFKDEEFDVVFSNSVIEHVGAYSKQELVAKEIRRVGKRYFIQTPNYYFPIEPHFMFLGFQWLPFLVRCLLVRCFNLGWYNRVPDFKRAKELIESIRLLKCKEIKKLFPDATIHKERFLGITKSFIAFRF